jgi:hypothetical protein
VATGWKAFKGDSVDFYLVPHPDPKNPQLTKVARQIWRKTVAVVYNTQTRRRVGTIPLFTFSSDSTKDLLMEYMQGLVGEWTLPRNVARDYLKQLTAERRQEVTDSRGRVRFVWVRVSRMNHYLDCEQMIMIAAIASRTLNMPGPRPGVVPGGTPQTKEGNPEEMVQFDDPTGDEAVNITDVGP